MSERDLIVDGLLGLVEIVVSKVAPLLFDVPFELFPVPFNAIPVHRQSPLVRYDNNDPEFGWVPFLAAVLIGTHLYPNVFHLFAILIRLVLPKAAPSDKN